MKAIQECYNVAVEKKKKEPIVGKVRMGFLGRYLYWKNWIRNSNELMSDSECPASEISTTLPNSSLLSKLTKYDKTQNKYKEKNFVPHWQAFFALKKNFNYMPLWS